MRELLHGESAIDLSPDIEANDKQLLATLEEVAPKGMASEDLTPQQLTDLGLVTGLLVAKYGKPASEEYLRYLATEQRTIALDNERVRQQLEGKTILITGGTGLIGCELVRQISQHNPGRVVSFSRGKTIPKYEQEGVEYLFGDIADTERVDKVVGDTQPDIIFHLAAEKYPGRAEKEVSGTIRTNIVGTNNLLSAAERAEVAQIVYASSGKATRPYSPDTYASSKKAGEWLMSRAAKKTAMLISGTRFTHVVDDSNIIRSIHGWIEDDQPIRLHKSDTMFYVQSAIESAQLLLNASIDTNPDELRLHALRNLNWPISLSFLAVGALAQKDKNAPIYICGVEEGYEERAWPGLYDPMLATDTSPLINFCEAPHVEISGTCDEVDVFPLALDDCPVLDQRFAELVEAATTEEDHGMVKQRNQALCWAMLNARLNYVPIKTLERSAKKLLQDPQMIELTEEHLRTNELVLSVLAKRTAA